MAVAFRSSSTAENQTASTFSVTKPAGATDGDLLIAIQETNLSGGTAPATPTNWTLLDRQAFGTIGDDLVVFYKVVASDGASYTFNNAGGGALSPNSQVRITCWSGAASVPESSTKNTAASGTTATALSITTAQANEYLLAAFGTADAIGTTITPDVALTDLGTLGTGVGNKVDVAYVAQAAAGASGNKTATLSGSGPWAAILIAIAPSGGGGASSPPSSGGAANVLNAAGAAAASPPLGSSSAAGSASDSSRLRGGVSGRRY